MFSFIRWKCGWRFGSTWQCAENYAEIRTYLVGEKLKIIAGQAVHLPQLLFFYLFDDDIFFSCSQKHKHPRHHELFFSPDSRPTVASVINKGPWTDTLMLTRSEGKKMFSWGKCSLQELRILLFVDVTLKNVRADFGGFRQFISKVIKLIEIESTVFCKMTGKKIEKRAKILIRRAEIFIVCNQPNEECSSQFSWIYVVSFKSFWIYLHWWNPLNGKWARKTVFKKWAKY